MLLILLLISTEVKMMKKYILFLLQEHQTFGVFAGKTKPITSGYNLRILESIAMNIGKILGF